MLHEGSVAASSCATRCACAKKRVGVDASVGWYASIAVQFIIHVTCNGTKRKTARACRLCAVLASCTCGCVVIRRCADELFTPIPAPSIVHAVPFCMCCSGKFENFDTARGMKMLLSAHGTRIHHCIARAPARSRAAREDSSTRVERGETRAIRAGFEVRDSRRLRCRIFQSQSGGAHCA